jgi:DNA-binding beta-propeller fold protein YncE
MRRHSMQRIAFALLLAATGCSDDDTTPPPPPAEALYVLNSLGGTIDRIDLATGTVEFAVADAGQAPNDLLIDDARGALWVAASLDNEVLRFDLETLAAPVRADVGTNRNPYRLAQRPGGGVIVTNWLGATATFLDDEAAVSASAAIARTPESAAWTGTRFAVSASGYDFPSARYAAGRLYLVPDGGSAPVDSAITGTNPQRLLIGPGGRLHVLCTGNYGAYEPATTGEVRVHDPATLDSLDTLVLGVSAGAIEAANGKVYVAAYFGGLLKYDGAALTLERGPDDPILDVPGLGGMAYDADRRRLYVAGFEDDAVYVIDTTADTLVTAWNVGDGPIELALGRISPRMSTRRPSP